MTQQITLSEEQVRALQIVAKSEKRSIDDLIRQAVDLYLEARREEKKKTFEDGFGAWGPGEDGLAYQERIRSEW